MPEYSDLSKSRLSTCSEPLQMLCNKVIVYYDMSVIWGHRGEEAQAEAYRKGNSDKLWPNSRHNSKPSQAVDLAPYPIDWDDIERFILMAGFVMCIAAQEKIRIRWGGAWKDYGHFEEA